MGYTESQSLSIRAMSFDNHLTISLDKYLGGLNPFRSGRCLSTGTVPNGIANVAESQSLSIRAMSFDLVAKLRK